MKSEYNFSKIEDQQEFDNLPMEKKKELVEKAHTEAIDLQNLAMMISGKKENLEPNDYENGLEKLNEFKKQKINNILKRIGVERDTNGKLILYHATPARYYDEITKSQRILPPIQSGAINWRKSSEKDFEKMNKIYLATKNSAEVIAEDLQNYFGGTYYILEVYVDENRLFPDEDTRADTWNESISTADSNTSNFGRSCAHWGEIKDFTVYKVLKSDEPEREDKKIY
jgi:hypothetical protein